MDAAQPHLKNPDETAGRPRERVTVVIPAKNEAGNIAWVLERLPASADEVVVVDGRSTDDTLAIARRVRPDVVIVQELQPGKGAALRAGVEAATGSHVVMIDADGSMDPQEIDGFLEHLREGHDLVKGSRFLPGGGTADMTPLRDAGNRCLLLLANVLYRRSHTDLCYGFAAFRRDAFMGLELTADGFEIEAQLFLRAARHGLKVVEHASFESARREGNSKLNTFRDGWRVLWTILGERVRRRETAPVAIPIGSSMRTAIPVIADAGRADVLWPSLAVGTPSIRKATVSRETAAMIGAALGSTERRDRADAAVQISPMSASSSQDEAHELEALARDSISTDRGAGGTIDADLAVDAAPLLAPASATITAD